MGKIVFFKIFDILYYWLRLQRLAVMKGRITHRPSLRQRLHWVCVKTWRSRGMGELAFYRRVGFGAAYIAAIALIVSWAGDRSDIVGGLWPRITWSNIGVYVLWSFLAATLIATLEIALTLSWNAFYEWYRWWSVEKWNLEHDQKDVHDWSLYGLMKGD